MNELLAVGINHHTASIETREEFHLGPEEVFGALESARDTLLREAFIISTCHRTELFGIPRDDSFNPAALRSFFVKLRPSVGVKEEQIFHMRAESAVQHLFRIASGTDSMILGDVQILGQVKDSYELAVKAGTAGNVIHHLLDAALHVGKRVRTETTLGIGAISISYAAVELAKRIFDDLHRKRVLLIGLGETGTLTARHLADKGVEHIHFTNRTRARAEEASRDYRATVIDFEAFPRAIAEMDIVISATSAEHFIVTVEMIKSAMRRRMNRPLLLIDIAAPRDVDPRVNDVANVFVKDIDALQMIVDQNLEKRREEIPKIERIISEELSHFLLWYQSLEAAPTIQQLRERFEQIRTEELAKFRNKIDEGSLETVEMLTKRIVNKLLHPTMVQLRREAATENHLEEKVQLLRELFQLGGHSTADDTIREEK